MVLILTLAPLEDNHLIISPTAEKGCNPICGLTPFIPQIHPCYSTIITILFVKLIVYFTIIPIIFIKLSVTYLPPLTQNYCFPIPHMLLYDVNHITISPFPICYHTRCEQSILLQKSQISTTQLRSRTKSKRPVTGGVSGGFSGVCVCAPMKI